MPPSPNKSWLIPLNHNLFLLDPFKWGLGKFNITAPQQEQRFTEETEELEEAEELEEPDELDDLIASVSSVSSVSSVNLKEKVEKAIKRTIPSKEGYRNFLIFQFCRWLKGISEFEQLPAKELKDIVREWYRRALPHIGTKSFDETWSDFTYGWKKVKYPKGCGVLKLATKKAMNSPNILDIEKQYDAQETKLLIRVCYQLQLIQQQNPFWLSCYDAGGITGISHTQANKRLQMLVFDGVLEVVKKNTTKKATRYKFIGK